jgi:hypothetical protein
MKTLDFDIKYSFHAALELMLAGKCLGIRPDNNTGYMELFKPHWMRGPDYFLR